MKVTLTKLSAAVLLFCSWKLSTKAAQKDQQKAIEGSWRVVSAQYQGKPQAAPGNLIFVWTFNHGKFKVTLGNKVIDEGTYELHVDKEPKWLDLKIRARPGVREAALAGIYEIRGDELKLCTSGLNEEKRPTRFASKAEGSERSLYVLKREKD